MEIWNYFSELLRRVRASKMARQAAWLFGLNLIARTVAFFGGAYAARCLGPQNLGISAQIQTTMQPLALAMSGGFDMVAIRQIANNPSQCAAIVKKITNFRLTGTLLLAPLWILGCYLFVSPDIRYAWYLGALLLLFSALQIGFAFQGLEKLPQQTAIGVAGSLFTALAYFLIFKPGMFAGADLYVIAVVSAVTLTATWLLYRKLSVHGDTEQSPVRLRDLFKSSWRYWLLSFVIYGYATLQFPLLAWLSDEKSLGLYRSAFLLAGALEIFFNSVNSLLIPRLVEWRKTGGGIYLWKRQAELAGLFTFIGLLIVVPAILLAAPIYHLMLGKDFSGAIIPFQILCIGRLVVFVGQIYAWGLTANHQDNDFFIASLVGCIFSVVANILLIPKYGIIATSVVNVVAELIVCGSCFAFCRKSMLASALPPGA